MRVSRRTLVMTAAAAALVSLCSRAGRAAPPARSDSGGRIPLVTATARVHDVPGSEGPPLLTPGVLPKGEGVAAPRWSYEVAAPVDDRAARDDPAAAAYLARKLTPDAPAAGAATVLFAASPLLN